MRPTAEEGQPLHDHIPLYFIAAPSTAARRPSERFDKGEAEHGGTVHISRTRSQARLSVTYQGPSYLDRLFQCNGLLNRSSLPLGKCNKTKLKPLPAKHLHPISSHQSSSNFIRYPALPAFLHLRIEPFPGDALRFSRSQPRRSIVRNDSHNRPPLHRRHRPQTGRGPREGAAKRSARRYGIPDDHGNERSGFCVKEEGPQPRLIIRAAGRTARSCP